MQFSLNEKSAIWYTDVVNEKNQHYGINGGNDTVDRVYLLSEKESFQTAHGFHASNENGVTRESSVSEYAKECGAYTREENGYWWLRSIGGARNYAMRVDYEGWVGEYGVYVIGNEYAVRPVLHINLYSSEWSPAGTVTSDGVITTPTPTPSPTMTPIPTPTVEPTPTPEITPGCVTMPPTPTPVIVPSQSPTQTTLAPVIPPTYPTTPAIAITEEEEQDEANPEWVKLRRGRDCNFQENDKEDSNSVHSKRIEIQSAQNTSKKRTVAIVGVAKKGQKKYDIPAKTSSKEKVFRL